ncbi:interferon lambda receptor 1 [Grammomys surdaster]|uniref:interferon lambda receptor 1 n=1 Tax=Grammomys surdaster TaxID=491861 RepID=UPI0010A02145|nr:interferon lambda receptor 1 [Grammomys surdaster]
MWRAGRWAPLLLFLLQSSLGRPRPAPPRNVTLLSQNFTVYLTWLPGLDSPPNVTYFVTYQRYTKPYWRNVKHCAGIKALVCPLMMCLKKLDLYNKFKGRVQAASAHGRSRWVESGYLEYLFDVELAPPTLVLTQMEKVLRVNATYQLPPCMPSLELKYQVEFWKEGLGSKTLFPGTPYDQPVQIPLQQGANGRYCLSARTVYTLIDIKYSLFSEPSCIFLEAPGASRAVLAMPLILLLLIAAAAAGVAWKKMKGNPWFRRVKTPQALDFSEYRYRVAAFQPSGPEFSDNLILCPQKELTIRIRPVPQVREPATLQVGPEKDSTEDEDEDTDDGDSIQPYLERPLFIREKLQAMEHSEADESGVDSGGLWTSPLGSEGSSAWDSSDRSWSSTGDSSYKDEAGSSSCLDQKEPDQEPLPCLEFSEDLGTVEEILKDDLSGWRIWGSLSPKRDLAVEPPVSLQTLTFCWDSNPEEQEEEEEEEEEEEDWEPEPKDSNAGYWGTSSLQRTEVRPGVLGDYMVR